VFKIIGKSAGNKSLKCTQCYIAV